MAFVKIPGSVSLYCSSDCYEKDLKRLLDSTAFLCIDSTFVVPSPDAICSQFHYTLIPVQHTFRTKWIGRKDREGILLWAREIPVYYPRKTKASSSDMDMIYQQPTTSDLCEPTAQCHSAFAIPFESRFNARNIKELTGGAHVPFTFHASVQTLVGVRIYAFVRCLPNNILLHPKTHVGNLRSYQKGVPKTQEFCLGAIH